MAMVVTTPDMSDTKLAIQAEGPGAVQGVVEDPTFGVDEKKLVAKLDRHIIPLVMLLYTFSFLDRYDDCDCFLSTVTLAYKY
jgi:hypothetical protein